MAMTMSATAMFHHRTPVQEYVVLNTVLEPENPSKERYIDQVDQNRTALVGEDLNTPLRLALSLVKHFFTFYQLPAPREGKWKYWPDGHASPHHIDSYWARDTYPVRCKWLWAAHPPFDYWILTVDIFHGRTLNCSRKVLPKSHANALTVLL